MKFGETQIAALKADLRGRLASEAVCRLSLRPLIERYGLCWAETHLLMIRLASDDEFEIEDSLIGPGAEILEATVRPNTRRALIERQAAPRNSVLDLSP